MAGLGKKTFEANEVLTAADVNGYLMDQSVMVFDDATARDAAIGTPTEGMIAYLKDTDEILKYTTTWESISNPGDITAVTAGTALTGGGTSGDVTLDVDLTAIQKPSDIITTQGDLIIGDASGDPTRLAIGTADQVLTSNGTTMTWADAAGGGALEWTLLDSTAFPTGSSTVSKTGLSGYDQYWIFIKDVAAASSTSLAIRFNSLSSGYNNGALRDDSTADNFFNTNDDGVVSIDDGGAVVIHVTGATNPDYCQYTFMGVSVVNGQRWGMGVLDTGGTAFNSINLVASPNITGGGTVRIYGA